MKLVLKALDTSVTLLGASGALIHRSTLKPTVFHVKQVRSPKVRGTTNGTVWVPGTSDAAELAPPSSGGGEMYGFGDANQAPETVFRWQSCGQRFCVCVFFWYHFSHVG